MMKAIERFHVRAGLPAPNRNNKMELEAAIESDGGLSFSSQLGTRGRITCLIRYSRTVKKSKRQLPFAKNHLKSVRFKNTRHLYINRVGVQS